MAGVFKRIANSGVDTALQSIWQMLGGMAWAAVGGVVIAGLSALIGHISGALSALWIDRAITALVAFGSIAMIGVIQAIARRERGPTELPIVDALSKKFRDLEGMQLTPGVSIGHVNNLTINYVRDTDYQATMGISVVRVQLSAAYVLAQPPTVGAHAIVIPGATKSDGEKDS